jgi:hypothetical protein
MTRPDPADGGGAAWRLDTSTPNGHSLCEADQYRLDALDRIYPSPRYHEQAVPYTKTLFFRFDTPNSE